VCSRLLNHTFLVQGPWERAGEADAITAATVELS
jgi:hypothetical protein